MAVVFAGAIACGARTELGAHGVEADASSDARIGVDASDVPDARVDADASHAPDVVSPPPDFLWYKLDEGSGTIAHDSSPNHADISVNGIAWGSGGIFHGACGVVDVGPGYRTAPVTITAWLTPEVRADEASNHYALTPFPPDAVSGDVPNLGGFGLGLDVWTNGGPGNAALTVGTGVNAPIAFHSLAGAYAANARHFLAVAIDASAAGVYVDGQLTTTVTADTPPPTTPTPLHLGCHNDDTGYGSKRFFYGAMRDVRIYKRLVGGAEIAQLFAAGPV